MSKVLAIGLITALLLLSVFATATYGESNEGALLFEEYFEAEPAGGYGTQRSLAAGVSDEDASILRQGIAYHQQADFDLALVAFRAFLESNPIPTTDQPLLLAATAAIATGHYAEGEEYLEQIAEDDSEVGTAANWHQALLHLRKEGRSAALVELRHVERATVGRSYPAAELIEVLTEGNQ